MKSGGNIGGKYQIPKRGCPHLPLDVLTIRKAKPGEKTRRLADERGLYLEISPTGGKWWRWKYRFLGKEKRLSLGTFPEVSLKAARDKRDDARRLLGSGVDPSEHRKAQKASQSGRQGNSLEVIAREWHAQQSPSWEATYSAGILARFENDLFPYLGRRPIDAITAPEILEVLRRIEERGCNETAHRAKGNLGQVFRYAIASGRCTRDPAADLRGALIPVQGDHHAAVTEPKELGPVLKVLHAYKGTPVVRAALKLAPLLFVRPGELRHAEWKDVDLEVGEWRYFVTKTKQHHIVPLATQAVAIFRDLHRLTGRGRFVFPGARSASRPMSENTVLAALARMDLRDVTTGHGFRASARTIMDEVLEIRVDNIEHQLAHVVKDPNGRAYNRTKHLAQRKQMMQVWADYLDDLRAGPATHSTAPMSESRLLAT